MVAALALRCLRRGFSSDETCCKGSVARRTISYKDLSSHLRVLGNLGRVAMPYYWGPQGFMVDKLASSCLAISNYVGPCRDAAQVTALPTLKLTTICRKHRQVDLGEGIQ
jgi:hypothetical protein